jgi:LPS-assembly lipoprotein
MTRLLATMSIALLLGACGFQLRQNLSLPPAMQLTHVRYTGTDAGLMRSVARQLALNDVAIARVPSPDAAVLDIVSARTERRVLSKDFRGRSRESEIRFLLDYRVLTADGFTLVPRQRVMQSTQVLLDPNDPLGSSGEIQNAAETLREDAVWEMLRQISLAEIRVEPAATADVPAGDIP